MPDFGFSLQKDRQIDFDANDKSIVRRVIELEPSFRLCIACGSCAATCTAGQFTDLSLRRIITGLKRAEYQGIEEAISKCMLCGKCQIVCPRGVHTRRLLLAIRKSFEEQAKPDATQNTGGNHHGL
jgi:heterodisulfide reductase subunit C